MWGTTGLIVPGKGDKSFGLTSTVFPLLQCSMEPTAPLCQIRRQPILKVTKNSQCCCRSFARVLPPSSMFFFTEGALRKVFMPEADASSFFKRRGKRAVKTQDEMNGEAICACVKTQFKCNPFSNCQLQWTIQNV